MVPERVGRYEVRRHLGSGGMGDVYLASDTQLDRLVALKFLPAEYTADDTRRARFLREARLAAAFSHPHVATVLEVLEHEGRLVLAMEYVEGETLRRALAQGPIPAARALRVGAQVADALAAAHRRGIVHRDVKPENVMITPDGHVKLLDFGLARERNAPPRPNGPDVAVTVTGMVVGTKGYFAPEQLQGRPAGPESDIFALGATLYEALTGRHAFARGSDVEAAAAVLRDSPEPASVVNRDLPPDIDRILARALAKDPAERYHDARDLAADLRELRRRIESTVSSAPHEAVVARSRALLYLALAASALAVAVAGVVWALRGAGPGSGSAESGRLRLLVSSEGMISDPALSPDGKMLAYVCDEDGEADLYLTRTSGGARVRLTRGPERERQPAFTPDGEKIVFARPDPRTRLPGLHVIPTLGGEPVHLVSQGTSPAWSPDGTRLAFVRWVPGANHVLMTVAADGGDPIELLRGDADLPFLRDVAWSPDGRTIAVSRSSGGQAGEIWLVPVDGAAPRRLTAQAPGVYSTGPAFTPDGRAIVFSSNLAGATNLWRIEVDGDRPPSRLTTGSGPDSMPAVSADGRIVFVDADPRSVLLAVRLDDGRQLPVLRHSSALWAPSVSPDGAEIAVSRAEEDGAWHVWSVPAGGGEARRVTSGDRSEIYPRYTPDGQFLVYATWSPGPDRLWRVPREGGLAEAVTAQREEDDGYPDVASDGRIAFARVEKGVARVFVLEPGGEPARLTSSPSTVPAWSPDGKWIAFSADRGYEGGVFVIRDDGTGERRLTELGGWPVFLPDGSGVAFQVIGPDGNAEIGSVPLGDRAVPRLPSIEFNGANYPFRFSRDGTTLVTTNGVPTGSEIWMIEP